jgi:hypothetical protein
MKRYSSRLQNALEKERKFNHQFFDTLADKLTDAFFDECHIVNNFSTDEDFELSLSLNEDKQYQFKEITHNIYTRPLRKTLCAKDSIPLCNCKLICDDSCYNRCLFM